MARNRASRPSKNSGYRSVDPVRSPRSAFDLSFQHKTTAYPSRCLPVYLQELVPGDTLSVTPRVFVRQLSAIFPVMDGLRAEMQFFFVPRRIVWGNWTKLQGERVDPDDHVDYEVPQVTSPASTGWAKHHIMDYMGVPSEIPGIETSALPARGYSLIWNEWYRDQNLQDSIVIPLDDGPDLPTDEHFETRFRGKPKDRFGGSLPFAQKGDAVTLPLGTSAPVVSDGTAFSMATNADGVQQMEMAGGGVQLQRSTGNWSVTQDASWGPSGTTSTGLEVDLQSATAATINVIRESVALQRLFERDARSGTRYSEGIYAAFGVRMRDLRYRPELIASGTVEIQSVEIPNYGATEFVSPEMYFQGRIGAQMKGAGQLRSFSYSADEWGDVFGILTIRSEISYSQGVPAQLLRRTRIDHFTPELQLLGEEAIPSMEIYADGTGDRTLQTGDYQPWGFTPRYESYRHRVNMISGDLRSYNVNGSSEFGRIDRFHYGLDFSSRPQLDDVFIEDDPDPIQRNVPHTLVPPFVVDLAFQATGVRPMAKTATPGLLRF